MPTMDCSTLETCDDGGRHPAGKVVGIYERIKLLELRSNEDHGPHSLKTAAVGASQGVRRQRGHPTRSVYYAAPRDLLLVSAEQATSADSSSSARVPGTTRSDGVQTPHTTPPHGAVLYDARIISEHTRRVKLNQSPRRLRSPSSVTEERNAAKGNAPSLINEASPPHPGAAQRASAESVVEISV
ncbi:unnamed protein product [Arctogadus glacialis]